MYSILVINFVIHFTFVTDLLTHLRFITVYKRHAPDIFGSALVRPSSFLPGCSPSISEYISRACQITHFLSVCTCSLGISTFCRCGCHVYLKRPLLPGLEYSGADTRSNYRKLILHIFTNINRIFFVTEQGANLVKWDYIIFYCSICKSQYLLRFRDIMYMDHSWIFRKKKQYRCYRQKTY
jgi:hypothetical protein